MPTSIVFLGAKPVGYDCFHYLIENSSALNVRISGLQTHSRPEFGNEKDLAALALQHDIPLLPSLDDLPECDIIYSVQYNELLKERHLKKAKKIAVNLHLAPLPEYRGCNQFSFAIMDEASSFGVSIHKIDTRIDHGDLLFQHRFPIPENCWVDELYDLTVTAASNLFKNSIPDLVKGTYRLIPQQSLVEKYGSSLHFRSEINALKEIDLNAPREEIEKRVRATDMQGFEPPFCRIGGRKYFFNRQSGIS